MEEAHRQLLAEIRRRLDETREDPNVKNVDGSNYWGPYVSRAIAKREQDGPALVRYIKDVLRKSGTSEGWNALLAARRLDLSFEDMVLHAAEPVRSLFTDEDRALAAKWLDQQNGEIERQDEATEAAALEHDRNTVAAVAARRRAAGKPWTDDIERRMLADLAARRGGDA